LLKIPGSLEAIDHLQRTISIPRLLAGSGSGVLDQKLTHQIIIKALTYQVHPYRLSVTILTISH